MSRAEAAAYLHLSLAIFDRDVRPQLPAWRKQRPIRFLKEDIDRWIEEQKAANSEASTADHSKAVLRSVPSDPSSALAKQFQRKLEQRLEKRRRAANG